MKVLHTSDWHLGKRLEQCERTDEHQHFLDWLLTTVKQQHIEVLLIAGDIFDSGSPSNTALKQYYDFLWNLRATSCREVIIIGGNHDSVSTLNAPRALLKYFNVHVIGGVPEVFTEQIIQIKDSSGETQLVVCAVPFLRDKDVRLSVPGETHEERENRLKQGICNHYNRLIEHIAPFKARQIPVVATGHLFAAGGSTSDSEKEIHVGNLGQICGDQFPEEFDYIALGHLHRPQKVNGQAHIRYSGSPIPLSFSEIDDTKIVHVLHFSDGGLINLEEVEIPCCRKLIRFKGDLEKVKDHLKKFEDGGYRYPAWVEVHIETENFIYDLDGLLAALIEHKPYLERIFTRQIRVKPDNGQPAETFDELINLQELTPKEVFLKKCTTAFTTADYSDLLSTFEELLENMEQTE